MFSGMVTETYLVGLIARMAYVSFFWVFAFAMLRLWDATSKIDYIKAINKMEEDPRAISNYFSARIIAVFFSLAYIIS